jgi:hypothetical protein
MTDKEALIERLATTCHGLDPVDPLRLLVDDVIAALREPEQEADELTIAYMSGLYDGKKAQRTEQERDEILQAITDPENQPSQFGTVTLEYHEEKIKQWEDLFDRMSANFERASDKAIAQRTEQEPVQPVVPEVEDFCYCNKSVSLQMVSGGAAPEGYLGRVTLLIDGEYVEYFRAQPPQRTEQGDKHE